MDGKLGIFRPDIAMAAGGVRGRGPALGRAGPADRSLSGGASKVRWVKACSRGAGGGRRALAASAVADRNAVAGWKDGRWHEGGRGAQVALKSASTLDELSDAILALHGSLSAPDTAAAFLRLGVLASGKQKNVREKLTKCKPVLRELLMTHLTLFDGPELVTVLFNLSKLGWRDLAEELDLLGAQVRVLHSPPSESPAPPPPSWPTRFFSRLDPQSRASSLPRRSP